MPLAPVSLRSREPMPTPHRDAVDTIRRFLYPVGYSIAGILLTIALFAEGAGAAVQVAFVTLLVSALLIEGFLCVFRIARWGFRILERLGDFLLGLETPRAPPARRAEVFGPERSRRARRVRPVRFIDDGDDEEVPGPATLAARARDTLDPLTRTRLVPGMEVAICRGDGGRCGVVFPWNLLHDLRAHHGAHCPACDTVDRFVRSRIPGEDGAAPTTGPGEVASPAPEPPRVREEATPAPLGFGERARASERETAFPLHVGPTPRPAGRGLLRFRGEGP